MAWENEAQTHVSVSFSTICRLCPCSARAAVAGLATMFFSGTKCMLRVNIAARSNKRAPSLTVEGRAVTDLSAFASIVIAELGYDGIRL